MKPKITVPLALILFALFALQIRASVPHGFYDVTLHGADPTGVADSTAALQAAINHCRDNQLVVWFPPGTYRISDRLLINQPDDTAGFPGILMGSTVDPANRATLYLAPNSPGFNDPANRKVMVHFINQGTPESESGGTDLYDQAVIGLDFKIGAGNAGAAALRMQGAEGCTIQDVHIDLTEGGHTGIWGVPGSGGSTHRVTIVGGVIGIDTFSNGPGAGTQPTPVVTGATFVNQSQYAVRIRARGAMVMVGCRFERSAPGPLFQITFQWAPQPFEGSFLLIDSEINYAHADPANTVIAMGSPRGRSFLFDNVYVRNAPHVFTPDATGNPTGWRHYSHLAVEVMPAARAWGQGREFVYIDGEVHGGFYMNAESGVPPPFDLQTRHQWAEDFPSWETPGVVDVTTLGAVGDGTTDNWAVLQQAINDHEILFFPKGRFAVSNTLDLRPDSKLIGAYITLSSIDALSSLTNRFAGRTEADPDAPIIRTADTAEAETWLANIHIRRFYPLAAHNPTTPGNYALEWRSGGDSVLRHVKFESRPVSNFRPDFVARLFYGYNTTDPDAPDYNPINPNHPQADFRPGDWAWSAAEPNVQVRGNGGGRWFNFWFHGRQHLRQETPFLRVEGTAQPLHIYHLHMQQEDSRNISEFLNVANLSIYGTKGEVKGAMAYFENCDNVRLFGNGGLTSPDADYFDPYLFRFVNCTNFLIAGMADTIQEGASQWIGGIYDRWIHANLLTWQTIQDTHPLRGEVIVPSIHRPILYRVGEPSGENLGGLTLAVAITAPATASTVIQGTYVTFEGSAIDENEGDLSATAAWTSSIDGLLGFGSTLTTGSLSPGSHILTFSATNSLNGFAARAIEFNVVPGGREDTTIISAEADTYVRGGADAHINFGTNNVLRTRGSESSEALYRFNLGGLFGNVTAATLTLTLSNADSGDLRVHDVADITWDEMAVTYNTRPALSPHFATVTIGGGSGTPQDIDVAASVAFAMAAGKVSFGTTTTGGTLIRMRSREGSNPVEHPRLSVTTLTDVLPIPPKAAITAPANGTRFYADTTIHFNATATDSAAADLAPSGQWSSSIDGPLGTGSSLSTSSLSLGVHIITFAVEDADELTAFAQILVRVEEEPPPPNQPPVATITTPSANTFAVLGAPVGFSGTVIDSEDGDLTADAVWTSSLDGVLGFGGDLTVSTLSLGIHTITLAATDSAGASGSAAVQLEIMQVPLPSEVIFFQDFSASTVVGDYQGSADHLFDSIATTSAAQNRTSMGIVDGRFQGTIEYLDDGTTDQLSAVRLTRRTDLPVVDNLMVVSIEALAQPVAWSSAELGWFNIVVGTNFRAGAFNPAGGVGNGPAFATITLQKRAAADTFRLIGSGGNGPDFAHSAVGGVFAFQIVLAANSGTETKEIESPTGTHPLAPNRISVWVNGTLYHDNASSGLVPGTPLTDFSLAFGSGTNSDYATGLPWNGLYAIDEVTVRTLDPSPPLDPYTAWTDGFELFGADAAPDADPDFDGVPNLLEYALGGNPTVPGRDHLPVLAQTDIAGEPHLTLTFDRLADPDLVYAVWASSNLIDWGTEPVWSSTGTENVGGGVTVLDPQPLSPGQPRFLRLEVTR
ncbi:MAG: DNRLRE domain-containing protein [Opitutales bacterium]|nr:DNRLRE domain-containing protein [Opitutales bacterium]